MKTEPELKKLAEFAVSFLRSANYYMNYDASEENLFNNWQEGPMLAHLALKEMEKRGFNWNIYTLRGQTNAYGCQFIKGDKPVAEEYSENQFIALWSAIEQTLEAIDGKTTKT